MKYRPLGVKFSLEVAYRLGHDLQVVKEVRGSVTQFRALKIKQSIGPRRNRYPLPSTRTQLRESHVAVRPGCVVPGTGWPSLAGAWFSQASACRFVSHRAVAGAEAGPCAAVSSCDSSALSALWGS